MQLCACSTKININAEDRKAVHEFSKNFKLLSLKGNRMKQRNMGYSYSTIPYLVTSSINTSQLLIDIVKKMLNIQDPEKNQRYIHANLVRISAD